MESPEKQQQFPELNSDLIRREAVATTAAVQQVLNLFGQLQADGKITFDSKSFHLAQSENVVTIASQEDNREILRAVDNEIIFNPTLQNRQNCKIYASESEIS